VVSGSDDTREGYMRSRKAIERTPQEDRILEVLLDIRDCLICMAPTEREALRLQELASYQWEEMTRKRSEKEKTTNG